MNNKIKNGIALSLPLQIILVKWFGSYPELVEKYYSEGLYPYISRFLRMLFGWIPFSMGDIFYTLLVIAAIRYLYLHGKSIFKRRLPFLRDLGVALSIAYFIFHISWGLNYYRLPLQEKLNIKKEYTQSELERFTAQLVQKTNELQFQITQDTAKAVVIPYSKKEVFEKTVDGYRQLQKKYPAMAYRTTSLKKSIYSIPLTYMGYGGYLNPFTNEAQVNGKIPIVRFPTVSGHEVGHQVGYSSESATNFIGFLVTANNEDIYFKYAAYSHALGYCLSDLHHWDKEKFENQIDVLHPGVKKNYAEIRAFWEAYENPTEPLFKAIFDAFLKANDQKEGIQSYNAVVDLLINYDAKYGF